MPIKINELLVPPDAYEDTDSREILRVWIANKGLHCSLVPDLWDDAGTWGIALADVARHVGNAIEAQNKAPADETVKRIQELFNAEINSPTDDPQGGFIQ